MALSQVHRLFVPDDFYTLFLVTQGRGSEIANHPSVPEIYRENRLLLRPSTVKNVTWSIKRYVNQGYTPYQPDSSAGKTRLGDMMVYFLNFPFFFYFVYDRDVRVLVLHMYQCSDPVLR